MRAGMTKGTKRAVKEWLGEIPLTAETYWWLRQRGKPLNNSFNLNRVQKNLPEWKRQALECRETYQGERSSKKVLIFATLRYWIEHAVILGMGMSAQGHDVTLAYLPYANWQKRLNQFDMRRQDMYARSVLSQASPLVNTISLYQEQPSKQADPNLPEALTNMLDAVTMRDVQYTLQVEEVDTNSELYRLRQSRNFMAARAILAMLDPNKKSNQTTIKMGAPQVILTPNGSILEMGAVYSVARYLDIPVVTYEFGEQRDRIWLAQDSEVMLQDTDSMWEAHKHIPLSDDQWETMRSLYAARQGASTWANFSRTWQGQPQMGGESVRNGLGLDDRPVVLLAANVIGDSLTLGRQVFSVSMTEWLQRTVKYFMDLPEIQLVVRIHPGEKFTKGPSVANVVRRISSELPGHIHIVEAIDPTNTYDIAEIASLGLVYTTTTGMEMSMHGLPVIVAGRTHYRGKGFTYDPKSWDEYFRFVNDLSLNPANSGRRLADDKIELAWQYAYRFFFTYPLPFPWHLVHFWKDLPDYPIEQVLSPQGMEKYGESFRCLAGEPRKWGQVQ